MNLLLKRIQKIYQKTNSLNISNKNNLRRGINLEPEISNAQSDSLSQPSPNVNIDAELEQLLAKQKAAIKVIGAGGGGNNTVQRISEVGIIGAETIAINTDAQDLLYTTANKKILIGRELTKGLGAGSDPKIGEEAARETEPDIKKALQHSDMVFITCGLGGGTGTGSVPIIAEIAKNLKK